MTYEGRDWRENLVEEVDRVKGLLVSSKRVAVLGIKPETKREQPAFYVAEYLAANGYDVIPVPVYSPAVTEICPRCFARKQHFGRHPSAMPMIRPVRGGPELSRTRVRRSLIAEYCETTCRRTSRRRRRRHLQPVTNETSSRSSFQRR